MIGGIIAFIGIIRNFFKPKGPSQEAQATAKAASAEAVSAVDVASSKADEAIANAEANAPQSTSAVVIQLRKGKF